jgi:Protein of unknown function (DUF2865)
MRIRVGVLRALAGAAAGLGLMFTAPGAHAQSLFETLFGPPKPQYGSQPNRLLPPNGINSGAPYTLRQQPPLRRNDDDDERAAAKADRRGGYHTVCVRLCDGYFWPVSYSAPRSRLYRDANVCSASCGAEAKLFHYPTNGGQLQDAVDLTGRVYGRLPTAFKYRKALVEGCVCKPAPWSDAEIGRHRVYALNEDAARAGALSAAAPGSAKTALLPSPPVSGVPESALVGDATDDQAPPTRTPTRAAEGPPAAGSPARKARGEQAPAPSTGSPRAVRSGANKPMPMAQLRAPSVTTLPASGFWGLGQPSKYAWPGDGPPRVR